MLTKDAFLCFLKSSIQKALIYIFYIKEQKFEWRFWIYDWIKLKNGELDSIFYVKYLMIKSSLCYLADHVIA